MFSAYVGADPCKECVISVFQSELGFFNVVRSQNSNKNLNSEIVRIIKTRELKCIFQQFSHILVYVKSIVMMFRGRTINNKKYTSDPYSGRQQPKSKMVTTVNGPG